MMHVMRNDEGDIVGVFVLRQEGFAEEQVDDEDPELIDFLTPINEGIN